MRYIFLPGNSSHNKEWIDSLAKAFTQGDKTIIYYNHWDIEDGFIDFDFELRKIKELNITEECVAICKSAGCVLSIKAYKKTYFNIDKFIFIGFPYYWARNRGEDLEELLASIDRPTLFIQKPKDPAIPFTELKEIAEKRNMKASFIEYARVGEVCDNHNYDDIKFLQAEIEAFTENTRTNN